MTDTMTTEHIVNRCSSFTEHVSNVFPTTTNHLVPQPNYLRLHFYVRLPFDSTVLFLISQDNSGGVALAVDQSVF